VSDSCGASAGAGAASKHIRLAHQPPLQSLTTIAHHLPLLISSSFSVPTIYHPTRSDQTRPNQHINQLPAATSSEEQQSSNIKLNQTKKTRPLWGVNGKLFGIGRSNLIDSTDH
jgi:hypothetical protein